MRSGKISSTNWTEDLKSINGVDSELYDWEEKLPRVEDLTDGMPPALQKLMGSREVKKMKSTFYLPLPSLLPYVPIPVSPHPRL